MAKLLSLSVGKYEVSAGADLRLTVRGARGEVIWTSSSERSPVLLVRRPGAARSRPLALAGAARRELIPCRQGDVAGHTVTLSGYEDADIVMAVCFAANPRAEELLLQVEQAGGRDRVESVQHFYRFEKPVTEGGYLVLPHGSGYLIPADCREELPGDGEKGGFVGGRWSLPFFGMVKEGHSLCALAEAWWDCEVEVEHRPDAFSAIDFHWQSSLGRLAYARRLTVRLAPRMDHVAMAKFYRQRARRDGFLHALAEKEEHTPQIGRYLEGVLVRWPAWNPAEIPLVLRQLERLQRKGLKVNFFFPKWPGQGYSDERKTATTSDGLWQGYLHPDPVPGGWQAIADLANKVRDLGCLIQGFVGPITQKPGAPGFDPSAFTVQRNGRRHERMLSSHDAVERNEGVLRSLREHGVHMDVLYYDGYSAHAGVQEDFRPERPRTRRDAYEAQTGCLADARGAGLMPGAELPRFWAVRDCDYWFFTDWSSDRLSNRPNKGCPGPVGVPVPLFPLVFHDCCLYGFSGGGYAVYEPGFDWWENQHPRLYELLLVAQPCHNWLPGGVFPYGRIGSRRAERRWAWLRRMSALCRATKRSEMLNHEFLSADRMHQRVSFANGVVSEFDMAGDRFRIKGVEGFSGDWQRPEEL